MTGRLNREMLAGILALLFVLAVPVLMLSKAVYDRHNGAVWRIDIAGYDPRDLLRGHYLQFQYVWNFDDVAQEGCTWGRPCCLCLDGRDGPVNPPVRIVDCADRATLRQCDGLIRGKGGGTMMTGNEVYFIPEREAQALESLLRGGEARFQMEIVTPAGGGAPVMRGLYMDGTRVEAAIRAGAIAAKP